MNIEEKIDFLRKRHPAFGRKVMHDVNAQGEEFCEIIYPNENDPMMPIAVSVSEAGCLISVGKIPNVTGDHPITAEQAADAIDDIVSDRIIFVLGYRDGNDGEGAPFMTELFPLTDGIDDKSQELEEFISKISTPVKGIKRKLTRLKGRFVICNFSGSESRTITR